jgi:N4-gp56 family major capsid protein
MSSFGITTYGDLSPRVGMFASANFLEHAMPVLMLERFARVEDLPKNKGQIIKWRRPIPFEVNVNSLVEGVTPAPDQFMFEDLTSVIQQYGAWTTFTDVIVDTHEDPVLRTMTALMGEKAGAVKEAIIAAELVGGTAVIYSGAATSRATVEAPISADELVAAQRYLKANGARPLTRMLKASTNVATEPVAPGYLAFGNSNLEPDFRDLPEFVVREKYASGTLINEWEIGKFQDIRVLLSRDFPIFFGAGSATTTGVLSRDGANVDVYPVVIVGQDAYGVTALRGMGSANVIVKNPTPTFEDPLAQRGFASWKFWYVATRLHEEWMVRIEAAASA